VCCVEEKEQRERDREASTVGGGKSASITMSIKYCLILTVESLELISKDPVPFEVE
jgi:hypothetical protein